MRDLIARLDAVRRRFSPAASREKRRVLAAAEGRALPPLRRLVAWHDAVLFVAAHSDDAAVRRAADRELRRLAAALRAQRLSRLRRLDDTGIAGTAMTAAFSPPMLGWLASAVRPAPELCWPSGAHGRLDAFGALLALPAETGGALFPDLGAEEWLRLVAGRAAAAVPALLDRLAASVTDPGLREYVLDGLDLKVRWRLGRVSRTITRFPARPLFYQRSDLLREVSLDPMLGARLPRPAALNGAARMGLLAAARGALGSRARETDPVAYANPREVSLHRLDRGVDVALFGLLPVHRLPVETYVGFVAARNRVPLAYGGGWVLFGRCEIGINLFEEFRGGESAFLFAQVLRTYRQRFAVRRFLVDPYQFGRDNAEAIESGAYWFYHRLGFRLTDPALRALAEREAAAIAARRSYRTSARVLRRLARSALALDVRSAQGGAPGADAAPAPDLARLGLALTKWVHREFGGDRIAALRWARRRVSRALDLDLDAWSDAERAGFDRLAPLVAMVPGLDRWLPAERAALGRVLRLKGGRRERDYAVGLGRLERLRAALNRLAGA